MPWEINALNKVLFNITKDKPTVENLYEEISEDFNKNTASFITMIDGRKCNNLKGLFKEFATKFKFPSYFSYNWDSFDECFNDLDWLESNKFVLFIKDFDLILKDDYKNFKIFVEILINSIEKWKRGRNYDSFPTPPTPFLVFIQSNNEIQEVILTPHQRIQFF